MAQRPMFGPKVRRLRQEHGYSQVKTATELGISASYLNLIEHNQRPLTTSLLLKLAKLFDVDLQTFSGDDEGRLLADLGEAVRDPLLKDQGLTREDLEHLVGSAPHVARAILALYAAYNRAHDRLQLVSEQISDDALLSDSSHELRTLLTSVRTLSEILHGDMELTDDERQHFRGIVVSESERLTVLLDRLLRARPDDRTAAVADSRSLAEEASAFFDSRGHYLHELETAAADLRRDLAADADRLAAALADHLEVRHGIDVHLVSGAAATGEGPAGAPAETVRLPEALDPHERCFRLAQEVARRTGGGILEQTLDAGSWSGPVARDLARDLLARYLGAAVMMPYEPFVEAAEELRYDIELLQRRFGAGFEQVCRRLTTLRRSGSQGVPFHFLRIDIAGNVLDRIAGSGMQVPRFGGVCPRWNVHTAFATPGTIQTQLARMPDGGTYFCLARAVTAWPDGFRAPPSHRAVGLGCSVTYAPRLVYADGWAVERADAAVPVGPGCRLCERTDCRQRAVPSVFAALPDDD